MKKYFVIAGEKSGDVHAAGLIANLHQQHADAEFVGLGGDLMQVAGCRLLRHYNQMAFMGVVAVLNNLGKIRENFRLAKKALLEEKPDVLILIDYPSFNLRMAKFCKQHLPNTKIVYYIPPKIWAWKTWRVHKIGRLCDRILGIFPFEPDFYQRFGYKAEYVGNPTKEEISSFAFSEERLHEKKYIAVLPGSRRHEVEKCLPRMLHSALLQEGYDVVVSGLSELEGVYEKVISQFANDRITLVKDDTLNVVNQAEAAIVNSGTATLETALIETPQVAVYHMAAGRLLALVRPVLFKIPYFTLPNIIANKAVIREWLAYEFTVENVSKDLQDILNNQERRKKMLEDYETIRQLLGNKNAPQEAAKLIDSL